MHDAREQNINFSNSSAAFEVLAERFTYYSTAWDDLRDGLQRTVIGRLNLQLVSVFPCDNLIVQYSLFNVQWTVESGVEEEQEEALRLQSCRQQDVDYSAMVIPSRKYP